MKYRFISVHKIIGVTRPAGRDDEVIAEFPDVKANALITYNIDDHLFELDREASVAGYLLMGLIGKRDRGDLEDYWPRELEEIRDRRDTEIGSGVFILFSAEGEVDSWSPNKVREFDDFSVVFDGAEKKPIYEKYEALIYGALSGLSIGSNKVDGVKKVTDGVYFIDDNDKPVYSFSPKLEGGRVTVSSGLEPDAIDYAKQKASALGQHRELSKPIRLFVRSLDEASDNLFSFLSAWFSLEVLVNRIFREYESEMFERFASTISGADLSPVVGRIRDVMKGKYSIADKFAVASLVLAPSDSDDDIALFRDVKEVRDNLMHGGEVSLKALPIENARKLFRKLIRLHLARA